MALDSMELGTVAKCQGLHRTLVRQMVSRSGPGAGSTQA
jgi:hypothetical protein